jgi:release factor glutamine methyltransferase
MTSVLVGSRPDSCTPPGVYAPQTDSHILVAALQQASLVNGRTVVDLCTGSGVAALAAARGGARRVTAWDICPKAVRCARHNAAVAGVAVQTFLGPLDAAGAGAPYDVVLANPPYVPAPEDTTRELVHDDAPPLACDAGTDGRLVLDRLCALAPTLLADGGTMLLVQSEFADIDRSLRSLRAAGMKADVVARRIVPFGPVLRARASWLEDTGRLTPGHREETLAVVRADKRSRLDV